VPSPGGAAEERPGAKSVRTAGGTEAILVVEDEGPVRDAARTILERLGYRVDAVTSPEEALRWVRGGAALDLLLTDVVLPGMNGIALAERVRAERSGVRVVFMSGYTSVDGLPDDTALGGPFAF